jgi:TonB family protein
MLRPSWRGLIVVPLLATAGVALAAQTGKSTAPPAITVLAGHETVDQWSTRVVRHLTNGLVYPRIAGTSAFHEGFAKIVFYCGEDGKPSGVAVLQSSGARDLDRAAMMAVKRISTLHPLPEGLRAERGFQAWVLFSGDEESYARRMDALQSEARLANAAGRQDQTADAGPLVLLAAR